MNTFVQHINLNIPAADVEFLQTLSKKLGWKMETSKHKTAVNAAPKGCITIDEFFDEQITLLKQNYK